MADYNDLLRQREELLAQQQPQQMPVPNVPTSLLGKIAVGANALAQHKDIGQTFRDLEAQRAGAIQQNQGAALDQNEQRLKVAELQKTAQTAQDVENPDSERSKKTQAAYTKMFSTLAKASDLPEKAVDFSGLSHSQLTQLKVSDIVKDMANRAQQLKIAKLKTSEQGAKTGESEYKDARKAVTSGAMAAVAGGRGTTQTVGRAVRRVQDARNAKQLLSAALDPKSGITADPQLAQELAVSVAALLGGSNSPAESTIKGLVPASLKGDSAKIRQYITGNPTQFFTPARMQQLSHTLDREVDYWTNEKNKFGRAYRESLKPYFEKHPDLEDAFDKTISAAADEEAAAQPKFPAHPQDNESLAWAKAHPNDPRATVILQANGVK